MVVSHRLFETDHRVKLRANLRGAGRADRFNTAGKGQAPVVHLLTLCVVANAGPSSSKALFWTHSTGLWGGRGPEPHVVWPNTFVCDPPSQIRHLSFRFFMSGIIGGIGSKGLGVRVRNLTVTAKYEAGLAYQW